MRNRQGTADDAEKGKHEIVTVRPDPADQQHGGVADERDT
jgi:hypothetical protein